MNVDVKLYGALRRYRPAGAPGEGHTPFVIALPPALTVADLLAVLNIPDGLASAAAVNDEAVEIDHPLRDGDRVSLFPPSAGGDAQT
jgi:molybdopterin synthase sulfur carrier subunit